MIVSPLSSSTSWFPTKWAILNGAYVCGELVLQGIPIELWSLYDCNTLYESCNSPPVFGLLEINYLANKTLRLNLSEISYLTFVHFPNVFRPFYCHFFKFIKQKNSKYNVTCVSRWQPETVSFSFCNFIIFYFWII